MIKFLKEEMKRIPGTTSIVVIIVILFIFSSFLIATTFSSHPRNSYQVVSGIMDVNGNLTVDTYAINEYGIPCKGVNSSVYLTNLSDGKYNLAYNLTSAKSGYANLTIGNFSKYEGDVISVYNDELGFSLFGFEPGQLPVGMPVSLFNCSVDYAFFSYFKSSNSPYLSINVIYFGKEGTTSPPVKINAVFSNSTDYATENVTFGPYSGFIIHHIPGNFGSANNSFIELTVLSQQKLPQVITGITDYSEPPFSSEFTFIGELGAVSGFFIVFAGIFTIDILYGQQAKSGLLDLELAQPLTRRDLAMSKMLTGSIFILILLGSLIGFDDVLSYFILGTFLPSFFVASLLFGIAVPTFSIMAISFAFTIHTRHGDIIGTLLFIFFAFCFLIFEAVIEGYVGSSPSKVPVIYQLVYFLSPVDYFSLIISSFEHGVSAFSGLLTFLPSNYVPLLGVVVAGGLIWVLVPVLILYLTANPRIRY